MSDLERRLHHAARELRAVEIEPPPLTAISARPRPTGLVRRVPALVMPVLFVLGGLAVIAGGIGRSTDDPTARPPSPSAVATIGDDTDRVAQAERTAALTVHQELALIARLAPPAPAPATPRPDHGRGDEPVRTIVRSYR